MSRIKNILRDAGYCSIGAAAVIVETGSKAVRALVRKGEKTLRENQDTVEELKRRARDLGEKAKTAAQKAASKPEKPPVDASQLSPEARAELRRQLDEADAAYGTDAVCETDPLCTEETACTDAPQPVAPDAIYRTETSAPAEAPDEKDKPESTPNG